MSPPFRTQITWEGGPGIVFDALISEAPSYTSDVPTAPTEQGYTADTVTRRPLALRLEVAVSDVNLALNAMRAGRVGTVRDQLLALQTAGTVVRVDTGASSYPRLVIQTVSWTRDSMPETQVFAIAFSEIRVATAQTTQGNALPSRERPRKAPEGDDKKMDAPKSPPRRSAAITGMEEGVSAGLRQLGVPL